MKKKSDSQAEPTITEKKICPICKKKLQKKWEGLVCRNHLCSLYFSKGKGWVYLDGSKKNDLNYLQSILKFNINKLENQKRWLILKSEILFEKNYKCEICNSAQEPLHIHHILSRSEYPNLTFDKENLMLLCSNCHKKIHKKDKYKFK